MKKILVFTIVALLSAPVFAQNVEPGSVEPGNMKPKNASIQNRDRLVLDFNFDNWRYKTGSDFQTKWFSRGFAFYMMYDVQLGNSKFSVAPGAGIGSSNVFFNAELVEDTSGVTVDLGSYDAETYKKSKFSLTYLEVPVEFRFRSKKDDPSRSFKLGAGFKFGVKLDAHTKVKRDVGTKTKIFKDKKWDDAETFRYGPTFRIGYGPVNAVIFYSLSDVFKKDRGPELTPFSVGISINGL